MSESNSSLSLNEAEDSFAQLERHLEAFLNAWADTETPPDLQEFLPPTGPLRKDTLAELIKIDLEHRWRIHNFPKTLSEYILQFPELEVGGVPADLIYEEFHIRKQSGQQLEPKQYIEKYADQETELGRMLGVAYETTALHKAAGKEQLAQIEPGQQLDDFELLVLLGSGAFAHVYLARQISMQRLVAVKISADHGVEPQMLAQMDHDHIVRVFDQRPLAERGLRLLYMQYVAGGTLQSVVREVKETSVEGRTGRLLLQAVDRALELRGESRPSDSPLRKHLDSSDWPDTVCWIGSRLALALDYAHERGILHRDLKPANVLVTADGVPKLADFNIGFSSKVQGVTAAAYFGGSLAYMSPEQLEASSPAYARAPDSLDGRSDLYSLGVLLWELLTGQRPFVDTKGDGWVRTLDGMLDRRRNGPDENARALLPANCPPGLVRVLDRCLAFDPEERWQSGGELAQQLELCRHSRAQDVLIPPKMSLRYRMRHYTLPLIVAALMLPNIVAGVFNFLYNYDAMIRHLSAEMRNGFMRVQMIINAIAYPAAIVLIIWRTRSCLPSTSRASPDSDRRKRLLGLGNFGAVIGVIEWTIAGIAYPVSIHLVAGSLPAEDYAHFFASLVLCGLIAAAYPFFLITDLSFRVIYPQLLDDIRFVKSDVEQLHTLKQRAMFYLVLGGLAPMLGIIMALFFAAEKDDAQQMALKVFSTVGVLGVIGLYILNRRLQDDLETVIHAAESVE